MAFKTPTFGTKKKKTAPQTLKPVTVKPIDSKAVNAPRKPGESKTPTPIPGVATRRPGSSPAYTGPQYLGGASALAPIPPRSAGSSPPPITPYATDPAVGNYMGVSSAQRAAAGVGAPSTGGGDYPTEKTLHGLAANFSNAYLPNVLANPDLIAAEVLRQRGMDPTGNATGLMAALTPYMDAARALVPLAWGGGLPPDTSAPINWLGSRAKMGTTPGGPAFDFRTIMDTLGGLGKDSATYQGLYGTGMSPEDQVNATKQIVYAAAQLGMPPEFQRAIQNMMNSSALNFYDSQYTGGTPKPFAKFMPNFYGQ
jgi:hypothetical protein